MLEDHQHGSWAVFNTRLGELGKTRCGDERELQILVGGSEAIRQVLAIENLLPTSMGSHSRAQINFSADQVASCSTTLLSRSWAATEGYREYISRVLGTRWHRVWSLACMVILGMKACKIPYPNKPTQPIAPTGRSSST